MITVSHKLTEKTYQTWMTPAWRRPPVTESIRTWIMIALNHVDTVNMEVEEHLDNYEGCDVCWAEDVRSPYRD